jgi:protein required for attachment to host cells
MRTIWIVVADASRARIVSKVDAIRGLKVVQELENPLGRAHNADIVTDKPGHFQKTGSNVGSAMDPHTNPHDQKAVEFAHQLSHLLEEAALRGEFDLLALVAPAHFLGLMREGLMPATKHRLVRHLANDFTRFSLAELEGHISDLVQYPYAETAEV